MNRLKKCIDFQLKSMVKSTGIFLCIYFAASLAITLLMLSLSAIDSDSNGSFNSGFSIGGAIFVFIYVIANYKEMFNYLLMFGNTRKNIFFSSVITSVVMSILLALVTLLSQLMDSAISKAIHSSDTSNLLNHIYNGSNITSEFLWFSTIFIMICSFSMLYSSLAYKLGKVFITVFWVGFGISWMILPAFLVVSRLNMLINIFKAYFCIDVPNGILLAPVNFIFTAIIFSAAAYLISSRQPEAA